MKVIDSSIAWHIIVYVRCQGSRGQTSAYFSFAPVAFFGNVHKLILRYRNVK